MPEATQTPAPPPRRPASGNGPARLRAVTRRMPRHPPVPATADGDPAAGDPGVDEARPEAGSQLSRAVGVMLLLHVVAFGGVVSFGMIKEGPATVGTRDAHAGRTPLTTNNRAVLPKAEIPGVAATTDHAPTPFPVAQTTPPPTAEPPAAAGPGRGVIPSGPTLSRVEADAVRLIESAGPNPLVPGERAYVVGRGDTVQTIAQKLRVDPAALLRLNHIDDPRKLQPGQRLRVPPSPGRSRP